jgi:hypothetical protein
MGSSAAKAAGRNARRRRDAEADTAGFLRWHERTARRVALPLAWARETLAAGSRPLRIVLVAVLVLAAVPVANAAYQVFRKPSEALFPVAGAFNKQPKDTWQQYGPLFRAFATGPVTPELLAALAQIESTGNPLARTYWRWRPTWNPFAIYAPASSAVGLYQMTDGAFDEARRYCVRQHAVVDNACGFSSLYVRVFPSHSVELASVYLNRNVTAVFSRQGDKGVTAQQKQDLAAVIHLCGAGRAQAFVRRGFRAAAGERCGDHDIAAYLAKVNTMKRQFVRLAAER